MSGEHCKKEAHHYLQPLSHNKILDRQFVQCVPTLDSLGIEFILFRGLELSI